MAGRSMPFLIGAACRSWLAVPLLIGCTALDWPCRRAGGAGDFDGLSAIFFLYHVWKDSVMGTAPLMTFAVLLASHGSTRRIRIFYHIPWCMATISAASYLSKELSENNCCNFCRKKP